MSQQVGTQCTRCDGTGWVDAELEGTPVEKDGWLSTCPYYSVTSTEMLDGRIIVLGVACEGGVIVGTRSAPE